MIRILILSASLIALAPSASAQTAKQVAAANKAALREPSPSGYVHAVQVYPFAEGVLYRLYTAPERVSDIVLQPGETVTSVAAGDTVRWTVGDTTSGSGEAQRTHILVKPFSAGLSTNLVITTDRRVYGPVVSLGVTVPIWNGGGAAVRREEARRAALESEFLISRRRIAAEREAAAARATAAREAAVTAARAREDAGRLGTIAETAYRAGEIGVVELLDAYEAARDADLSVIAFALEAAQAAVDYDLAIGKTYP